MSDALLLLILVGAAALSAYQLAGALRRGELRLGETRIVRGDQPADFWIEVLLLAAVVILMGGMAAAMVWTDAEPNSAPLVLLFSVGFARWWVRHLVDGHAVVGTVRFARHEEPREFWVLQTIYGLLLLLILASLAVPFVGA
jgi:hypothetical protein